MMTTSYYKLEIENRENVGKKASKSIRRAGKIPSILYYKGEKPNGALCLVGELELIRIKVVDTIPLHTSKALVK